MMNKSQGRISKELLDVVPYRACHQLYRLDLLPFAFLYILFIATAIYFEWSWELWLFVECATVFVHILVFLCSQWSISFKCLVTLSRESSIQRATVVRTIAAPNKGKNEICKLNKDKDISFVFQKRKYVYNEDKKFFEPLRFFERESIEFYKTSKGHSSTSYKEALAKWGPNEFDIPMPTFSDLYKEQALAPFFVFQIFCVLLWCLDEYWYYSLFTLALLLMFEGTVVKSRLKNLESLRSMRLIPRPIQVYRDSKWRSVSSTELVPGDICSLSRMGEAETVCPCDMLLLSGNCIVNEAMLTGESTPHLKEAISHQTEPLNMKEHQLHILFGGTKIIQSSDENSSFRAPDGGCIAFVLRTGFNTSQGKLMRVILFSTERMTANTKESLLFILFLLVFALVAAGYVLQKGLEDETRSRYKLLLNCILIITSVVPPELPMELTLAVNNSLLALYKLGIFCTEPFRIPFAGKVDICCFDKTGTLTSDDIIMKGVAGLPSKDTDSKASKEESVGPSLLAATELPDLTTFVLAACHSLVFIDGKLVGDPMETASLQSIQWSYSKGDVAVPRRGTKQCVRIVHRYHFTSALKRMSVLVSLDHERDPRIFALSKGAPEVLLQFMDQSTVPDNYEETYKHFARRGCRVLALAHKQVEKQTSDLLRRIPRDTIEAGLTFAGFVVLECPLKEDSSKAIQIVRKSSHAVTMITGDNMLTACHVAATLKIVTRPALIFQKIDDQLHWQTIDESETFSASNTHELAKKYSLCVSGPVLSDFVSSPFRSLLHRVKVFARVSPDQKEIILSLLKENRKNTLMCGDGTNDVGALKQAHVGVALLNAPPTDQPKPLVKTLQSNIPKAKKVETLREALEKLDEADVPRLQLGDASIAAPFTVKSSSVMLLTNIIRQGRCTLVTTLQMFKILALNCLITAYCLSVLTLDGVKFGDMQATMSGMLIAMCFLFISRSKPLQHLSKQRPHTNIFSPYMMLSIGGQFAIHLYCLIYVVSEAKVFAPQGKIDIDADFAPNLVNSAVFLMSAAMQVATFAINYKGHPFMQSLWENKPLLYCLGLAGGTTLLLASEWSRDLNESLDLVPFPAAFRNTLMGCIIVDFIACWTVEKVCSLILG